MKNRNFALLALSMAVLAAIGQKCAAEDLRSPPKSGRFLVAWAVTQESGKVSTIVSRSGDLARFSASKERSYAISAVTDGEAGQPVTFRILTVKEVPGAGEMLKQVEKFALLPGATYSTSLKPSLVFRLNKVSEAGDVEPIDISEKPPALVAWEVSTPSKEKVRFVGRDGETVRLELPGGKVLGMTATIRDPKSVDFRLLDLSQESSTAHQLDIFTVLVGDEHRSEGLAVRLTSINPSR